MACSFFRASVPAAEPATLAILIISRSEEPIVELYLVVKNALPDLIRGPHPNGVVRIITIAAGEDLVAISRWIEEVNRLPPRDAIASGSISRAML